MPDQKLYFQVRPAAVGDTLTTPLSLETPLREAKLDQTVTPPGKFPPIRLKEYLPQSTLDQRVVEDKGSDGRPAVRLSVDGPTQSYQRWLLADDAERNRLISFIATWRLMRLTDASQRDELFDQFKNELTRKPKVLVGRIDSEATRAIALGDDLPQKLDDLGCTVRVRHFFPDYAMDDKTMTPVNRSEHRVNPAALVEIEHGGVTEQRWVFAKFPGFVQPDVNQLPYRVSLDCPVETPQKVPDYAVVVIGADRVELWTRHEGETKSAAFAKGDAVAVHGSQYKFKLTEFVECGRIVEEYKSAARGVAALRVEIGEDPASAPTVWLEMNKPRTVSTPAGALVLSFGTQPSPPPAGGHP